MPATGKPMRVIKEILRLCLTTDLSDRQIARSVRCSHTTVAQYASRAREAGLAWPLPENISEMELRNLLRDGKKEAQAAAAQLVSVPDWEKIHLELGRKKVTLKRLWREYVADHPEGYRYSRFCDLYRAWAAPLHVTMRQRHTPGEKLFVDYSGMRAELVDPDTGEITEVEVFVAALGYSHMIYAEATMSQRLDDWLCSHVRALEYFGGAPKIIVPDNLRSAVTTPCRFDPEENPAYGEFAEYYQVAVIPARVRRPKDKPKVEKAVQMVEYEALAVIRDQQFFSLAELNAQLRLLIDVINDTPFQKLSGTRRSLFEADEKPLLQPLPQERFTPATWSKATVALDYHVCVDKRYYSVPYRLYGKTVEIRTSPTTVLIYHCQQQVASHKRSTKAAGHPTTLREHMPSSHRRYAAWTPERILRLAERIGPHTHTLVHMIMEHRRHPEQGFRTCMGLVKLCRAYTSERMESLAFYAIHHKIFRLKSLRHVLDRNLDLDFSAESTPDNVINHSNIRGPQAFALPSVQQPGDIDHGATPHSQPA